MNTYQENYRVRYSEGDRKGRLKLRTFFDYAQEVAGNHATALGCGLETLLARRQAWVLSRLRLRVHSYPSIGDTVTMLTWPSGFDHLFARREFELRNADDGQLLAEATSLWLFLDTENLRILSAPKEIGPLMPDNTALGVHFPEVGKLPPCTEGAQTAFPIRETQIDLNGHLNNAEYAAFVQDALGGELPRDLQLNYQKSVPPSSCLELTCQRTGEAFSVTGRVQGNVSFVAAGTIPSYP